MFSKAAILATVSFALAVFAAPGGGDSQCNTGAISCCNKVAYDQEAHAILEKNNLLGLAVQGTRLIVGDGCSPVVGVLGSGGSCSAHPMCCNNNNYEGLIVVGCTPISVGA